MKNRWERFLNCGLDPDKTDPFVLLHHRHLMVISLVVLTVSSLFLYRAVEWQILSRILSLSLVLASALAVIVFLRFFHYPALFSHLQCVAVYVGTVNAVYTNGGISLFVGAWLALPSLMGVVLMGRRSAVFWLLMSLLAAGGLYYWEFNLGNTLENLTPEPYRASQLWLLIMGFILAVFLLSSTFLSQLELAKDKLYEQLQSSQKEVGQRRLAEQAATDANKSKSQFLANMSHELRTPLNAIIGFSKRLESKAYDRLNSRELDALNGVRRNGEYLLAIINELLDIAKIESGHYDLNYTQVDMVELVQEVANGMQALADQEGILLELQLPQECVIVADKLKIKQVLVNFIGNGLKYTERGVITVRLKPSDNNGIQLEFEDTGIGIAPEDLHRIFDEYNHVHSRVQKQVETTGLGLPLAAKLIRLHGGTVQVESQVGAGSKFTVFLPNKPTAPANS